MKKTTIYSTVFAIIALVCGVLMYRITTNLQASMDTVKPIEFSLPDVNEQMQSLSQWRGQVLVINFWATWCAPCLKEIPEFIKLQTEYGQQGLQFIGIAVDDKQAVTDYLRHASVNYPVLIAGDEGIRLSQQLGNVVNAVPFTIIVNRLGQVIHRQPGEISASTILEVVNPLIFK